MKKFITTAIALLAMSTVAFASGDVNVTVNSTPIDMKGIIVEGRTMVPVRGVFEQLGYEVSWDDATKTATLSKGTTKIEMTNGNDYFSVNGEAVKPDVPQQIVDGRFMLPLRAVGESINANVDWDSETKTASVTTGLKIGGIMDLTSSAK